VFKRDWSGRSQNSGDTHHDAQINDFRIDNRALSAQQKSCLSEKDG
jgi:hypothetical protein